MSLLVTLPLPGATITQAQIDELMHRKVIAPGIMAFHAIDGLAQKNGGSLTTIPAGAPYPKRWADFTGPGQYITVDGFLDTSNPATWSDFTMTVVGLTIARFWQERATAKDPVFARIPRLVIRDIDTPTAMNMWEDVGRKPGPRTVTPYEAPYPLAKSNTEGWSWPTSQGLRFDPVFPGLVQAFDYQEYGKEYPLIYSVGVGGGSTTGKAVIKAGQEKAFFMAAGAAYWASDPVAAAAQILNQFVEVK